MNNLSTIITQKQMDKVIKRLTNPPKGTKALTKLLKELAKK